MRPERNGIVDRCGSPARGRHAAIVGLFLPVCLAGCGEIGLTPPLSSGDVALLESAKLLADRDMLTALSGAFFDRYADEYDMVVVWGSSAFAPGNSFYLPVRNDVPGIGYEHVGPEYFDDSAEFGSQRLEGVIWMGPSWLDHAGEQGPRSVLSILAHETAHRWGCTIRFQPPGSKSPSNELLGTPFHWSFFLDSGDSPLGGNRWVPLGDNLFRAEPITAVGFAPIDLYLMGLLAADDVPPLRLLFNSQSHDPSMQAGFHASWPRVTRPLEIEADLLEIPIAQIIDVEGLRDGRVGFSATRIRQAWILVHEGGSSASPDTVMKLEQLLSSWADAFSTMTQGRSSMITTLTPRENPMMRKRQGTSPNMNTTKRFREHVP